MSQTYSRETLQSINGMDLVCLAGTVWWHSKDLQMYTNHYGSEHQVIEWIEHLFWKGSKLWEGQHAVW